MSYIYKAPSYKNIPSVTDKSQYRPDAEAVRSLKFNPAGGDGSVPMYDYPDGKVTKDKEVSQLVVAIRSGRFDKAELAMLQESIIAQAKADNEKAHMDKVAAALDKSLGINSDNAK